MINNKFYVGMHSTSDINDGYLGSGKRLRYAIRKHGKENFKIERLKFFETRQLLINAEIDMVNEDLLKDPFCMNLKPGGSGGFTKKERLKGSKIGNISLMHKYKYDKKFIKKRKAQNKKAGYKTFLLKIGIFDVLNKYDWTGKKHKQESKDKIGKTNSIKQKGKLNSQYGTCWIHNLKLKISKSVKNEELNNWLNLGWIKGRKMKF